MCIRDRGFLERHDCPSGEQLSDGFAFGSALDGMGVHKPTAVPASHVMLAGCASGRKGVRKSADVLQSGDHVVPGGAQRGRGTEGLAPDAAWGAASVGAARLAESSSKEYP
eukprot:3404520-Prorocentrum_lima.AAC.1